MIVSALVGLGKAFGNSRKELRWLCIELRENERSHNNQVEKVEPGRAGGSSAWSSMSSALGRARPQPGRAPRGPARGFGLLCFFDDSFAPLLFEAFCISFWTLRGHDLLKYSSLDGASLPHGCLA